ncbi:MAG: 50S ribosomal protein L22 [Candidatus Nomurabacteria bacterium]|nr:50S ribosomal protein L22 [Candidatus Nomurabacteria bacterium]
MKAFLKNYRQSPRKVRLVAELIKSKRVADAIVILDTLSKRASGPVQTLLASAVANAKQAGIPIEGLFVDNVTVNKGIVMKRSMPRARGSASRINKRTSHVLLTLSQTGFKSKKEKAAEKIVKVVKTEKKATKPAVKKSSTTKKEEAKA